MKFVLATNNAGKLREMRGILRQFNIEAVSQGEAGADIEVLETGATFYENALLKAKAVCKATGLPAIADDSGLLVDALGGAPGIRSKRYGGGLTDSGLCEYLLKNMENMEQRGAKFVCSIVCAFPDGDIVSAEGEILGDILYAPRGEKGFGYDPVFQPLGMDKSMAELSQDEKNAISHRAKALQSFLARIFQKSGPPEANYAKL
jgi:XTP/dITP diphosphohydrolase